MPTTWDRFAIFANGVEVSRIDGKIDWEPVTIPVTGSKTTIRWSFYRTTTTNPTRLMKTPTGWMTFAGLRTERIS